MTAVEVPVRVLKNGKPVRGLTRDDFEVYQNGVRQDITQFETISRAIVSEKTVSLPGAEPKAKRRLFILIFSIFDYNDAVGEAIDYFFEHIFQPNDQIIAVTEDLVLSVERGKKTDELIIKLKDSLKTYKAISTRNTFSVFRDLRNDADRLLAALEGFGQSDGAPDQQMIQYFEKYRRAWIEYQRRYLAPDISFFQTLVQRIKPIAIEKWAICFQQRDLFPWIKSTSRLETAIRKWIESPAGGRSVQASMENLKQSFDLSNTVSSDALREIFLAGDVTFHLILLKSFRPLSDQDFELREVGNDYEDSLRKVSKATGGYMAFSNQPMEALKEASQLEDCHYLLVYSPKEGEVKNRGEIEVKVRRSGLEVISLKNSLPAGPPPITISEFASGLRSIGFALRSYQMKRIEDRWRGLVNVRVTLYDKTSEKVFDEEKTLEPFKKDTHISMNFSQLKPGPHFIIIQAVDKLANQTDVYSGMIKI